MSSMKNIIRFDWALKRILRDKANFGVLEGLLSELLDDDIKIDSILPSNSDKDTAGNKCDSINMLVQNGKGDHIAIELYNDYMYDYLKRIRFPKAGPVADDVGAGLPYGEVKKIIAVHIVYFDLGDGEDYIYHGTTNFTGVNKKDTLSLSPQEQTAYCTTQEGQFNSELYIIRLNQFDGIVKNSLDEWIAFLKRERVNEQTDAKGLKEAIDKLHVYNLSEEERREYDWFITDWRDSESIAISAYVAGQLKAQMDFRTKFTKNCLSKGIDIALIADISGLTEEHIKDIQESL